MSAAMPTPERPFGDLFSAKDPGDRDDVQRFIRGYQIDRDRVAFCGMTLVDEDGDEYPCDERATGWRWYQECGHEDVLSPACNNHSTEAGRLTALAIESRRHLSDALDAANLRADMAEAALRDARADAAWHGHPDVVHTLQQERDMREAERREGWSA